MKLLAWDTSSKSGAIAALEWDPREGKGRDGLKLVSEWSLNVDATHSERLLWAIHQVLESARWKIEDVDYFGVGIGPGSFTGLRIGITTARTLAHSLGKPLIPISSLAALVRPVASAYTTHREEAVVVIGATDAAKGELFALFGNSKSIADCVCRSQGDLPGYWKRGVEEEVLAPDELIRKVKKKLSGPGAKHQWTVVGEARVRYPELWKELPAARRMELSAPFPDQIQGRWVALLAWEGLQAGLAMNPLDVHPAYLRASDAEVKLKAGLLRPSPVESDG
jgi:tRNA threonylcarbamoyladenosine biosynthesis protein TsaB